MNSPGANSLRLEPEPVREYLDEHIRYWQRQRDLCLTIRADTKCEAYLEAYQGMRVALFGERLDLDDEL